MVEEVADFSTNHETDVKHSWWGVCQLKVEDSESVVLIGSIDEVVGVDDPTYFTESDERKLSVR